MTKWLLAGVAMISAVIAAEPPNRQFRFGSFEVTAVQDASSAMRAELFPGIPGTRVPAGWPVRSGLPPPSTSLC